MLEAAIGDVPASPAPPMGATSPLPPSSPGGTTGEGRVDIGDVGALERSRQAPKESPKADIGALEDIIDREGIQSVLGALEEICYGKAEHLRANWQDENQAKAWESVSKFINRAWTRAGDVGL